MTEYITPLIMLLIIVGTLIKKAPLYSLVTDGAEEGLKIALGMLPSLIMTLTAVEMLKESGAIDFFAGILSPVSKALDIPEQAVSMVLLRPVSGSASLAMLTDIFRECGPDSRAGMLASVIMCSTETTFYVISVYFGAANVKRTSKAVICAVIGDIAGILIASAVI